MTTTRLDDAIKEMGHRAYIASRQLDGASDIMAVMTYPCPPEVQARFDLIIRRAARRHAAWQRLVAAQNRSWARGAVV